jgi:hypothetical protein
MYLDSLLAEVFQDKETPLILLRKYELDGLLEKAVHSIDGILSNPPVSVTSLVGLAPSVLVLINSRLSRVTDAKDKGELELLMAEVSAHLLKKLLAKSKQPATALREIKNSLETASSLHEFKFEALLNLLNFDNLEASFKEDETYWYEWTGKPHELDELAERLRRQGVIKSVKSFKELFKNHGDSTLQVHFAKERLSFVIALFDELRSKGLIVPRGGTGHFHPLKVYGVDLENKVLIKNEPKSIKKNAKKKPEIWEKAENWAKDLVGSIVPAATSKSPRVEQRKITRVGA